MTGEGGIPLTRLTPQAREVWAEALHEAHALGHEYIGVEHFILALTHQLAEEDRLTVRVRDALDGLVRLVQNLPGEKRPR